MQHGWPALLGTTLICVVLRGHSVDAHPIDSVISVLGELSDKAKEEGKAEELTYKEFERWCKNSKDSLDAAVKKETAQIATLEDKISGMQKKEVTLKKQIAGLEEELGKLDAASLAASEERASAATLYTETQGDFNETVGAISDALAALVEAGEGGPGPAANLAVVRQRVQKVAAIAFASEAATKKQRNALQDLLGQSRQPELQAAGDRAGHVKEYTFKSGGVIELLKELKGKFEDEKLASIKAETNAVNAYALASTARQNSIKTATDLKGEKSDELAVLQGDLSEAEGELSDVKSNLEADSTLLSNTDQNCNMKASEWAERSATREKEIEAIKVGMEILSKVTGVRTSAPENPAAPPSPIESFLQVQPTAAMGPKQRAMELLRKEARKTHSRALERLAQEIAVHSEGPFDELNGMIQKMVQRLMSEQTDEDNHKNWCDAELSKSDISKTSKLEKHDALTVKLEVDTAKAAARDEEIKENSAMLEQIAKHMAEATEIRSAGKSENDKAIKDSQDAQTALTNAISVLTAHYKESGMVPKEKWEEFLQQRAQGVELPAEPSTWASGYSGVADPKKQPDGIISLMEEVSAQFARMEAETRAQEQQDQQSYEDDMSKTKIEKARRIKETEMKTSEKKRLLEKIGSHTKKQKQTASELEAVNQYISDLQPACVDGDSSYDDRKAARAAEIGALQEAQTILAEAFAAGSAPAPAAAPATMFLAPVQLRKP